MGGHVAPRRTSRISARAVAAVKMAAPRQYARIARSATSVRLAYFMVFLSAGVWLPYMPLYLSSLGLDGWQVGVLGALAPGIRWMSAIVLGWLADRHRIRRRLLVATAAVGSLCFVPLLFTGDFSTLVVVFLAINVCHGTLIPMVDAIVVDHLAELGNDYGRLRLWGSISFIVGSAGSAPLVHAYGPSVIPILRWRRRSCSPRRCSCCRLANAGSPSTHGRRGRSSRRPWGRSW